MQASYYVSATTELACQLGQRSACSSHSAAPRTHSQATSLAWASASTSADRSCSGMVAESGLTALARDWVPPSTCRCRTRHLPNADAAPANPEFLSVRLLPCWAMFLWVALRAIAAATAMLQVMPAHADELVISNTDLSVQVSGPWQHGSTGGSDYLYRGTGAGGATVFWPFPSTLGPGQYQVFANWVSGPDRATSATYWVASDGGTQAVTENQQVNGGQWQSLGTFQFELGSGDGVTLTDSSTGVVVAGAVRWVSPGNAPAPVTAA